MKLDFLAPTQIHQLITQLCTYKKLHKSGSHGEPLISRIESHDLITDPALDLLIHTLITHKRDAAFNRGEAKKMVQVLDLMVVLLPDCHSIRYPTDLHDMVSVLKKAYFNEFRENVFSDV